MLFLAIGFFVLAAALGAYLLSFVLQDKETPKGIAFIHGPAAAIGLLLLIVYAFFHHPAPMASIIIFILAAMGGTFLIYRDLTGKPIPKAIAMGHGLIAVIGFVWLLFFAFYKH